MRENTTDLAEDVVSRRAALKSAGAVGTVATMGLAGCMERLGLSGGSGGSGDIELVFWHTEPEDERKNTIADLAEQFEEENEGITVDPQAKDETDLNEQVLAGAAAGRLPNVILPNTPMVQELGIEGVLSTEAAGEVMDRVGSDRFLDGPLNLVSADDSGYYGVPHSAFTHTFWWRSSVFEEQELPEPSSWDAIRESAQALHDPENDLYGIGTGTETDEFTRNCITPFLLSNGGRVLDENGDVVFDSPAVAEALEFYAELAEYNPPGRHSYETIRDLYLGNSLHNTMWSTHIMRPILSNGGAEMAADTKIVATVEKETDAVAGFAQALAILNADNDGITEEEVQASIDFCEYLYEDDAYIQFLHLSPGGFRPVIDGITDQSEYQDNEVLEAWGDSLETIDDAISSERFAQLGVVDGKAFPEFGRITSSQLVEEACTRVIEGEDPQQVADEQAAAMQEELDQA